MEQFKNIKGYEGLYQVSNLGRVKSLKYGRERLLNAGLDGKGYLHVNLYRNKKPQTLKVHKLVAIAFLNHKPCGHKSVVNHKDFNKLNNVIENLEIVSQRENANQKHLKSTSKYVGVSWDKTRSKWRSQISENGINNILGYFVNEQDASDAYQEVLKLINNITNNK